MRNHRSILDKFVGASMTFCLAAVLIYVGVHLLAAVLPWLIGIGAVVLAVGIGVAVFRYRADRW